MQLKRLAGLPTTRSGTSAPAVGTRWISLPCQRVLRRGPIPGVGAAAASVAPILSTLVKLKIGSVPQGVKGFDRSIGKVRAERAAWDE